MSALQVIHREFNGEQIQLIVREDGTVWFAADQVGLALGYKGEPNQRSKSVRNLFGRHMDEVGPYMRRVKLTLDGVTKEVMCFRREGTYLLACFARTEKSAEFRLWVATTCEEIERGEKAIVSKAELDQLKAERDQALAAVGKAGEALCLAASLGGAVMAHKGHLQRKHPELFGEPTPQIFFEFVDDETAPLEGGDA